MKKNYEKYKFEFIIIYILLFFRLNKFIINKFLLINFY